MEESGMNEIVRDAGTIAAEINAIKAQVSASVVAGAVEIGKRLAEAKEVVPRGEWGSWLETHVDYSERTAQNLMRCWEEYGKTGKVSMLEGVSLSNAITLLGADPAQRRELVASGEAAELSNRELKERLAQMEAENAKKQMRIDELMGDIEGAEQVRSDAMEAMSEAQKAVEEKKALEARLKDAMRAASDAREQLEAAKRRAEVSEAQAKAAENETKLAEQRIKQKAAGELTELKKEADELRKRAADAEARAAAAEARQPEKIEVTAYETPPEVEAELNRLREIAAKAPSETVIKVRDSYNRALGEFNTLKGLLGGLGDDDRAKYKAAIAAGLRKMVNAIEEG